MNSFFAYAIIVILFILVIFAAVGIMVVGVALARIAREQKKLRLLLLQEFIDTREDLENEAKS